MPCVLFAAKSGVGGRALGHGQIPDNLVTKPLVRTDDLMGKNGALSCHQVKEYHKRSVLDMQDFDSVFVHGDSNVHTRFLDSLPLYKQPTQYQHVPILATKATSRHWQSTIWRLLNVVATVGKCPG